MFEITTRSCPASLIMATDGIFPTGSMRLEPIVRKIKIDQIERGHAVHDIAMPDRIWIITIFKAVNKVKNTLK